ncbi:MAG: DUF1190 domain-containing protein [Rhodospirillales bacterium]|nr:DUF1190 domain-containing protein [Rhodospirillales bacterium]
MIKLRPLLLASVAAIALTACDDKPDLVSEFVRDEAQCASQSNPGSCRQALMDAREAHVRTAPAFASAEACEEKFGAANCQPVAGVKPTTEQLAAAGTEPAQVQQANGSFFMPLLAGYMMGRLAGGGMAAQPLYRDTQNRAYSGTTPTGKTFDSRTMPPPRPVAQTASAGSPTAAARPAGPVERGGFGRTGTGRVSGS